METLEPKRHEVATNKSGMACGQAGELDVGEFDVIDGSGEEKNVGIVQEAG